MDRKMGKQIRIMIWLMVAGLLTGFWTTSALAQGALGDLGKPPDYNQTIKDFEQEIPDFDSFIDALPSSYDWRDYQKVTSAKDQGYCGSCWAFACAGTMESKVLMDTGATANNGTPSGGESPVDSSESVSRDGATPEPPIDAGPTYDISEQQQVSCNTSMSGCCGGSMTALQWYTSSNGPMVESCTGYGDYSTSCPTYSNVTCASLGGCSQLSYYFTGYYTVDMNSDNNVKTSVYNDGPSYFRFDVYQDFQTFWNTGSSGQAYTQATGSKLGGHAVLIIGWDDAKGAWLLKNSWGATGGPNGDGTFWMAYSGHANDLNFGMANVQLADGTGECALVNDGSFETSPSAWTEWRNVGSASRIVTLSSYWGISAYDGTYAWWGGGYYGSPVSNYAQQSISVPAGATSLQFKANYYRPDSDDASADYFYVKVNGTTIFTKQLTQAADTYPNWTTETINIASYAGSTVTIRFEATSAGTYTGNVAVDYVEICAASGWRAAYEAVFDDPSELEIVRQYRDEFLTKTEKGKRYTKLLYESSETALDVLLENPDLISQAKDLIENNKDAVEAILNGNEGTIYNTHEVVSFLSKFARKSPVDLQLLAIAVKKEMLRKQKQGEKFLGFWLE